MANQEKLIKLARNIVFLENSDLSKTEAGRLIIGLAKDALAEPETEPEYHLSSGDYNALIKLADFFEANAQSLDGEQIAECLALEAGQEVRFGGGAAGDSTLRRVR